MALEKCKVCSIWLRQICNVMYLIISAIISQRHTKASSSGRPAYESTLGLYELKYALLYILYAYIILYYIICMVIWRFYSVSGVRVRGNYFRTPKYFFFTSTTIIVNHKPSSS